VTRPGHRWGGWTPWIVLVCVVGVALAVGRAAPAPVGPTQRAQAIDASLRCPSCEDASVADSSASSAAAIRRVVAARVRAGQSTPQIDAYLVSRYGTSILLTPSTSGISGLVWIVPLVAIAAGVFAVAVLFWRRRRVGAEVVSAEDRALVTSALAQAAATSEVSGPT
jgi:cytochrome c-type biogenesis protein CcmH